MTLTDEQVAYALANRSTLVPRKALHPRQFDAFEQYVRFRNLPALLRYPPKDRKTGFRPSARDFAESMGIGDEDVLSLVELRTQKRFAAHYGITQQTLCRWNKRVDDRLVLDEIRRWSMLLTPNVMLAMYRQLIVGDAPPALFKLFFQVVGGWNPREVKQPTRQIKKIVVEVVDPVSTG